MPQVSFAKNDARTFDLLLSAPIIYALIIPIVFSDLCLEIYHRSCFPLYNIPFIPRSRYIKIDRHKLKYLNIWQKIGCAYCGYANGVLHYASVIAAATELYWCPILHKETKDFKAPTKNKKFSKYDDLQGLRKNLKKRIVDYRHVEA